MDFTYELEADGWALITHADGGQYRIRYDNKGEPLCPGSLHVMTVDGMETDNHRPTAQRVGLVRIAAGDVDASPTDICLTAPKLLHAHGHDCVGSDHVTVVVRLLEVKANGDWVVSSLSGDYTETITTAKYRYNA